MYLVNEINVLVMEYNKLNKKVKTEKNKNLCKSNRIITGLFKT